MKDAIHFFLLLLVKASLTLSLLDAEQEEQKINDTMPTMRILVVEDDPNTAATLQQGLKNLFQVDTTNTIVSAEEKVWINTYDAIVLDLILPDGNGLDLCRYLQQNKLSIPTLILSAKDAVENKIRALDIGANDYLTKPFHMEELIARIRAVARKQTIQVSSILTYKNLELDQNQHQVSYNNIPLLLRKKEYDLLKCFLLHPEKVLTRQMLLEKAWGSDEITYNTIDVHIKNLRGRFHRLHIPMFIQTIRGVGYILKV